MPHDDEPSAAPEPFDMALFDYYGAVPNWVRYRGLVELGVKLGDPLATYAAATWYLYGEPNLKLKPNPRKGIRLLERAARSLNRAMYEFGVFLADGLVIPANPKRAYRLFSQAAELGCAPALMAQATCLVQGFGVRRNVKQASLVRARAIRLAARTQALLEVRRSPSRGTTKMLSGRRKPKR